MSNLFKIGRYRDLIETDLYTTLDDHTSSSLGDQLEKTWRSELAHAYSVNRKPTFLRALIRMFGAKYMCLGFILCIHNTILKYLATGESMTDITYAFRMGKSTVSKIIVECCNAIWDIRRVSSIH